MQLTNVTPLTAAPQPDRDGVPDAAPPASRTATTAQPSAAGPAPATDRDDNNAPPDTGGLTGTSPNGEAQTRKPAYNRFKLAFHVDDATKRVVISVIDPETNELIRQVPPEEVLQLAERLESVRGSFFSSTV